MNPPRWEIGHIGWFQEFWCRRYRPDDPTGARAPPRLHAADRWWDSRHVPHDVRWDLPLPDWDPIHAFLAATLDDALASLRDVPDRYFHELALYHEDMHGEALLMTLQTLALPAPRWWRAPGVAAAAASVDVAFGGGPCTIGSSSMDAHSRFVFDNEQWSYEVTLAPFAIASRPVTQGEFAAFVDAGGYVRDAFWPVAARAWRDRSGRTLPAYWHGALAARAAESARLLCAALRDVPGRVHARLRRRARRRDPAGWPRDGRRLHLRAGGWLDRGGAHLAAGLLHAHRRDLPAPRHPLHRRRGDERLRPHGRALRRRPRELRAGPARLRQGPRLGLRADRRRVRARGSRGADCGAGRRGDVLHLRGAPGVLRRRRQGARDHGARGSGGARRAHGRGAARAAQRRARHASARGGDPRQGAAAGRRAGARARDARALRTGRSLHRDCRGGRPRERRVLLPGGGAGAARDAIVLGPPFTISEAELDLLVTGLVKSIDGAAAHVAARRA